MRHRAWSARVALVNWLGASLARNRAYSRLSTIRLGRGTSRWLAHFALVPLVIYCASCEHCPAKVTVDISVAEGIEIPARRDALCIVSTAEIYEGDVNGRTPQGLPIGQGGEIDSRGTCIGIDNNTRAAQWADGVSAGDPIWYYAYIDSIHDRRLNEGEAFGIYDNNPIDVECGEQRVAIVISDTFSGQ